MSTATKQPNLPLDGESVEEARLAPVPITPLDMLSRAVDSKLGAAELEKLTALAERWEENRARAQFANAMAACQAEMPTIVKDSVNTQTSSRFVRLETVLPVIKPIYLRHGFSVSFTQREASRPELIRVVAIVRLKDCGYAEEYYKEAPPDGEGPKGGKTMNPLQGVGSNDSYLKRYLFVDIFGLVVADRDTDGNSPLDFLNEKQTEIVNGLLEQCRKNGVEVNFDKFLKWLEVDHLTKVRAGRFTDIVDHLMRKAESKKGK